jgi:hypothetical protein
LVGKLKNILGALIECSMANGYNKLSVRILITT